MIPGDDPLWDVDALPVFELELPDDWQTLLWDNIQVDDLCAERPYTVAQLRFENPLTGETEEWADVGVRHRGYTALTVGSSEVERVGFKLSFNEFESGRRFHDLKKINLLGTEGDQSLMREHLAFTVSRSVGLAAPRSAYALLKINGALQGVFPNSQEADDSAFLDTHFDDPDGNLYKVSGYCGTIAGDLSYQGADPETYVATYEPKAGTDDAASADDLIPMLACTEEADDDAFRACIEGWIDVDWWLKAIAVDFALPDVDGMSGRAHNYLLYMDPDRGRFVVYPWDRDQAFQLANLREGDASVFDFDTTGVPVEEPVLVDRLQQAYPDEYCAALGEVAAAMEPAAFRAEVEAQGAFLWDLVDADPFLDVHRWKAAVQDVIDSVAERQPRVAAAALECAG
jgi:spore coat protein H